MIGLLSSGGGTLTRILMIALSSLAIWAPPRWVMSGPDPISVPKTILLGITGSSVGRDRGKSLPRFSINSQIHPV